MACGVQTLKENSSGKVTWDPWGAYRRQKQIATADNLQDHKTTDERLLIYEITIPEQHDFRTTKTAD